MQPDNKPPKTKFTNSKWKTKQWNFDNVQKCGDSLSKSFSKSLLVNRVSVSLSLSLSFSLPLDKRHIGEQFSTELNWIRKSSETDYNQKQNKI